MVKAYIQLVARDIQNIYLNGNPDVTLFKSFYKRISNFALESVYIRSMSIPEFGRRITIPISGKYGDLISNIVLEIILPEVSVNLTNSDLTNEIQLNWIDRIGEYLFNSIELDIAGTNIVKYTGQYLNIQSELNFTKQKKSKYYEMIGKSNSRNDLSILYTNQDNGVKTLSMPSVKLYLPLHFWFNKKYTSNLPIIAMNYADINLHLDIKPLNEVFKTSIIGNGTLSDPFISNENFDILTYIDFILLDTDERRMFAQSPHEYLIEQVQINQVISNGTLQKDIPLYFNNAGKEIIWNVQLESELNKLNYSNFTLNDKHLLNTAYISIENNDIIDPRDADYYQHIIPMMYHTSSPQNGIYNYTFCEKPEQIQPSGTINFSKLNSVILHTKLTTTSPVIITIYAISYNVCRILDGYFSLVFKL